MNYKVIVKFGALVLVLAWFFSIPANSQNERRFIRKGTRLYQDEKYLESEIEYRKALEQKGNSFEARFNMADALFKQEKVDEAIEQFQAIASQAPDKEKKSDVYHNIGNGYFAKQELEKSIEAYKEALRNDPLDDQTRYNLIVAQKMLENQQNQQDQNQEQDQEQQDKEQEQKEQEQKQQEQEQQKQQQQQPRDEELSKENAQRILQSLEQDEKELQERLRKVEQSQSTKTEKDW